MKFLSEYSPDEPVPLGGYAGLTALWAGAAATFVISRRRSGRPFPDRVPLADLALLTAGTYKLSRLITKDRVMSFARAPFTRYQGDADRPSEVNEQARGHGLQHSIGELLVCPYCISQWVGGGLLAAYIRDPELGRSAAMLLTIVAGSDFLHQAWAAVDKRA
ncbi:MAG: DUF1360 domain-containing protein [Solirubrobacteraceae bacterium]